MRLFKADPAKPFRPLLHAGVVSFVGVFVFDIALLISGYSVASDVVGLLIYSPLMLMLLVLLAVPAMLMQGLLLGAPSVSISYVLSAMVRNWRGIAGAILLSVSMAAIVFTVFKST